jgi:hypothetical protein
MRLSLARLVLAFALASLTIASGAARAADPPGPTRTTPRAGDSLDPRAVPEPLRAWIPWVLDGKEEAVCPTFFDHPELVRCVWPSRLELALEDHGGRFSQKWHADVARSVPLPGDEKRWPSEVTVDGARASVITDGGAPSVRIGAGDHALGGAFAWDSLPESLRIPPQTGLLTLRVRGAPVDFPSRDAEGTLWLQKGATKEEGDSLDIVVQRMVTDDIPLRLTTRIELRVAGKSREERLGKALPDRFVPMSLDSPVPARMESDGRLRVQVRPGNHTLTLVARSEGPVVQLGRPDPQGPWAGGDEVWVFEARNGYRVVTLEGVASIDPQQTTLPEAWRRFPAYPMKVGAALGLVEKRRGDADPPPSQLSLERSLWLDFDGAGYSVRDKLSGTLSRDSRLTMAPPTVLGRVSIQERDQFITRLDREAQTGVEVRQGELDVVADSRIDGDPADVPAVGWAHDFRHVSGKLHLGPGWKLVHASGVDDVPDTWVKRWTLLDLFLALFVAIGAARLYGAPWGALAAVTLFLTIPEEGAPMWSWLAVLALAALVRVIPAGRVRKVLVGAHLASFLLLALAALPFLVEHVREGMYPALGHDSTGVDAGVVGDEKESPPAQAKAPAVSALAGKAAPAPGGAAQAVAPLQGVVDQATVKKSPKASPSGTAGILDIDSRSPYGRVYDQAAVVQTGPGLPHWRWTTLDLNWSGPVASTQRLHLYLLSPQANLWLAFLRAVLVVVLVLRLFPFAQRFFHGPSGASALLFALVLLGPRAVRADIPDPTLLQDLAERLTRKPACSPTCASTGRMALEVTARSLVARLEVDAAAATAVPLPGNRAEWTPADVLVDGHPAVALLRTDDGVLWVELGPGPHVLSLAGPLPQRATVHIALPMQPHHVAATSSGWTVAGVHEDGLADANLELVRLEAAHAQASAALEPTVLPPFVRVERTLHAGIDWQLDTRIERLTPIGSAIVLEVPLLAGENVTTADVRVQGGKALVNMGPEAKEIAWHSELEVKSPLKLVAPSSLAWIEVWRMEVGPIWHATFSGIPWVHAPPAGGLQVPEWHPWPGETVTADLVRPDGVAGQTLTIDESSIDVQPGVRATDVLLKLRLRSSRGADHTLTLPPGAQLQSVSINGEVAPIRQQGSRVTLPVVPGAQRIELAWRETPGVAAFFSTPRVDLGARSVNATTELTVPGSQWLLFVGGPRVGPAVLFWSLLLVLVVVSILLGINRWTPLRSWHWLLLAVGLSQVSVWAGAVFVGWLLALGWRSRSPGANLGTYPFNLRQLGLAAWTLVALAILAVSLYQGLLGAPEMQVIGNGSNSRTLRWFSDRSDSLVPAAWMVSVPILIYRAAMLAWALWIALALLRWLRWGWDAISTGGLWKKAIHAAPKSP